MKEPASSEESEKAQENPFNILIVDNDVEIILLLKDILSLNFPSVKVHAAYNGAQAFKLLDNLTSNGINIDYVLTNYVLPILNGAELCKSIKQAHPTTWTAIMTCFLLPKDENLLYSDEILFKPIDFDALFKSISDQMKNK
ncbi:MAG TPA: response regulator [Candidatus Lokiarchaeia archaeon]|nr:response regulator [Candidatus Lokiarchaeia archaeon]